MVTVARRSRFSYTMHLNPNDSGGCADKYASDTAWTFLASRWAAAAAGRQDSSTSANIMWMYLPAKPMMSFPAAFPSGELRAAVIASVLSKYISAIR